MVVAVAHVVGEPVQLLAPREEGVTPVLVATAVADVPLAAGDDLQRAAAALVELHRVGDRSRVAAQVAARPQQLDHLRLRLLHGLAGQPRVGLTGVVGGEPGRCGGDDAAVAADDAARRQVELAPPRDVGGVAERADHGDAGALVRLGQRVGDDRDLDAEDRRAHGLADEAGVALVVGVGDHRHAADDELGPRGVDEHVAVRAVEGDQVVVPGPFAVLDLGLGDGRAVVDVPHRRRLGAVGLAAGEVAQEGDLAGAPAEVVDRLVLQRPVERQPEPPEQLLEGGLVGGASARGTAR